MREIRPYGSARGVRSNPYPYRDTPYTRRHRRRAFHFPRQRTLGRPDTPDTLREHQNLTSHCAGFATTTGQDREHIGRLNEPGSGPDWMPDHGRNRRRKG